MRWALASSAAHAGELALSLATESMRIAE